MTLREGQNWILDGGVHKNESEDESYQSASINLCRHWPVGDLWPSRITISPWAEKVVH